jgi:hypothetical protein
MESTAAMPLDRFLRPSGTAYPYKSTQELRANEVRRIRLPPVAPSAYMVTKDARAKVNLEARPIGKGPSAVIARLAGKIFTMTKKFEIVDEQWFEGGDAMNVRDRQCIETPMDADCIKPSTTHVLPEGSAPIKSTAVTDNKI